MNLYVFFIILFVIVVLTIIWLRKQNKSFKEHSEKVIWGIWFIWFVAMMVSVHVLCGVNTVWNRKLEEVKAITSGSFVSKYQERSKLEKLLDEDEEYYSFTTEDGKEYEIGESSIIGKIPEEVRKIRIYQADTYEGYKYFYLLRKKKDHLYEFVE